MQAEAPKLQPDESAAVGILQHLNKEELQSFLDDDAKLTDIINDLNQVKKLHSDKEVMMASNKSLAEYNVSLQPRFESLKTRLGTAYEEVNKLKTRLAMDQSKLDGHSGDTSLDTISVLLQTAASTAEDEAEEIASDFLDKKLDVDTFLETFLAKRQLANIRMVKSQKMPQLMREQQASVQSNHNYSWSPMSSSAGNQYPASSSVPYPSSGGHAPYPATYAMPQAGYYNS